MGTKRPIKRQVMALYGEEIAQADKMAKIGYDKKTKKLDESIYGPTTNSFNPEAEMQLLYESGITDDSFLNANEKLKGELMGKNKIVDALEAIQMDDPTFDMQNILPPVQPVAAPPPFLPVPPIPQPVVEAAPEAAPEAEPEEQEKEEGLPEDPEARFAYVAKLLFGIYGSRAPTEAHLRQWKQMHGNVFVLKIDETIFLYRYIKRQEWKQILADPSWNVYSDEQKEDFVATRFTLFPPFRAETQGGLAAGTAPLLAEQVRIHSLFLDPAAVAGITVKL